jgi:hypothetical protein
MFQANMGCDTEKATSLTVRPHVTAHTVSIVVPTSFYLVSTTSDLANIQIFQSVLVSLELSLVMAEAIGLVASIVQLTGTGLTAYEYAHQVKNAPKEQAAIVDEIWSLVNLLTHLRRKVENAQDGIGKESWLEATTMLTPQLDKLQHALEEIAVKVVSRQDEPWNKIRKRIVWPWNEKKCLEILSRIRRLVGLIRFALQESNLSASCSIKRL